MKTKSQIIKQGTCILTEKPFVYVLNSKFRTERCDHCLTKTKVLKCTGCHYVYYCGRVCQSEAWTWHKAECSCLKRVAPRIVPDAARIMARIILKLQKSGDLEKGYYTPTNFRKFKDLMSHYSDIKLDEQRMEHLNALCAVLSDLLGQNQVPNSAELLGIYGRLVVNGFNILDGEMCSVGTGIYLGVSITDHSCKPNAVAVFEGTTIFIRTLVELPCLDWSQIFICYVDLMNTPEDRRNQLKQTYYFLCVCSRCVDNSENELMQSAACPNSKCDEPLNVLNRALKSCPKCEEPITEDHVDQFKEVSEFISMQLQQMKDMAYLDVCKICIKRQRGLLHPLNLQFVKILDSAFESAIEMGQWTDAKDYGQQLVPGFKTYYGELHPLLGLLYLKIGKILLFEGQSSQALKRLKEAADILKITHGEQHSLYRKSLIPLMQQALAESS